MEEKMFEKKTRQEKMKEKMKKKKTKKKRGEIEMYREKRRNNFVEKMSQPEMIRIRFFGPWELIQN